MLTPVFYTLPGNEAFIPHPVHPGEDAGADIRLYAPLYDDDQFDRLDEGQSSIFIDGEFRSDITEAVTKLLGLKKGFVVLRPGETILAETGFKIALPSLSDLGHPWSLLVPQYKIVPRSGLAHKHGIVVTNSPGIVDSGYRDWVRVSLTNRGTHTHVFTHGARIAQGLIEFAFDQSLAVHTTDEALLSGTARGEGGFGSTSV